MLQVCHIGPQENQSTAKLELQTILMIQCISKRDNTLAQLYLFLPFQGIHVWNQTIIFRNQSTKPISYCMVAGHIPNSSQQWLVKHCFPEVNYSDVVEKLGFQLHFMGSGNSVSWLIKILFCNAEHKKQIGLWFDLKATDFLCEDLIGCCMFSSIFIRYRRWICVKLA